MITLYSTDCPMCLKLEKMLDTKHIVYIKNLDKEEMLRLGYMSAPILKVDDNNMNFVEAVQWILKKETDGE